MGKHILLAGATGLVGSAVQPLLLADGRVAQLTLVGRKRVPGHHGKQEQWIADNLLEALRPAKVDAVICTLGTTIRKAGSQEAFIAVDRDLPIGIGKWAKEQGASTFVVVSALGADTRSRIFYSRVKGEVEAGLEAMGFSSLSLFQPSVLTGPRAERRRGEGVGAAVLKGVAPLLKGRWAAYRIMPHDVLAQALVEAALEPRMGVHRLTYHAIVELAAGRHA